MLQKMVPQLLLHSYFLEIVCTLFPTSIVRKNRAASTF